MIPKNQIKEIVPTTQENGKEGNQYACVVNRKTVIDTLEAKANVTGFKYILPDDIPTDYIPVYKKTTGELLRYDRTEPVEITDVDSTVKQTVRTSHYLADKVTPYPDKKAAIGVWINGLAGSYHGKNSSNWTQEYLTLQEIIDTLNKGYAIAPGEFQAPAGESIRTAKYCMSRQFILFDGDEWIEDHPAPNDISELIERYPDITTDFYWIGESISSRSSLKPELRCRLMLVLPTPIRQGEDTLWQTVIDAIVAKYPFIARGVGIDKVRLSFGNARLDCENRFLYGIISEQQNAVWKQTAAEKQAQAELEKQALAEQKERQAQARQVETVVRTELQKKGYELSEQPTDTLVEFCKADPATLLTNHGIATHLQGNEWNYTGSSAGRSLELVDSIIKPFSNSAQSASPADDPTSPVNAHRYIAYILFGLDMTKQSDKRQLRCELANAGYGTHPDEYDKHRKEFERIALKEGLLIPTTAPTKLINKNEYQPTSENINVLRLQNEEGFQAWIHKTQDTEEQHILIIATAAGTGKTTLTILKLDKSVDISPIKELADAKFETAVKEGKNAVRHRPRNYNRNAAAGNNPHTIPLGLYGGDTVPCVFPDHCNALAQRGYNPITTFCSRCTRKTECEESGYLSQYKTLSQYDQIFVAWNEGIMTDPHSRKYIKSLTENGDYVGVLDEVDPADLCPQRGYTTNLLVDVYEEFRDVDCDTAPFLRKFIRETSTATSGNEWTNTVRSVLDDYEKETLNLINDELQRIPVIVKFAAASNPPKNLENREVYKHIAHITYRHKTITCAVLTDPADDYFIDDNKWILKNEIMPKSFNYTHETARLISVNTFIRLNFVSLDTPESINLLPRRLQDFTQDLQSFVDSVAAETPPAQRTDDGWDYYLLPALNMRRVVFISASGVDKMISNLYKDTEIDISVIEGKPPAWQKGCKLYQVSTGRYTPNQSLIEKDPTTKQPTGLKPRAVEMINIVEKVATAAADKQVLVVAPKAFTKDGALAHITELKTLHELPNVTVINHAHAEGVNSYEDHEISFVFAFEPPPDEVKRIAKCIYRTETLTFERVKTDVQKGGVTLKEVERYADKRVQSVHDKECEKTLMQAITRQRQMLHPNRTCYLFTSEPVGGLPTTPILFTLADMFTCLDEQGNLDTLDAFLEKQAKRTVKEVAEQDDVSQATAYRKTENKRKNEKENTAAKIIQLYDDELSERENAKRLGISRGKLQSILKYIRGVEQLHN